MEAGELSTLRLSARTLAEWRTPASTRSYERVFSDLVNVHPFARVLGIDAASKILTFDDDGTILWFLSETLSSGPYRPSPDDDLQWQIAIHCISALIDFAGIGQNDIEVWPKGPLTSQVADEIDSTLEKGLRSRNDFREASEHVTVDLQCSRSAAALVSIAAPLDEKTCLAMIVQLKGDAPSRGYLQKLSAAIRKLIKALKTTQTISGTATGIGLLTVSISLVSGLEATSIFGVVTLISLMISLASKLAGDRLKKRAAMTTNVVQMVLEIVREITNSDAIVFPRLYRLEASKKEALGSSLLLTLGKICGYRNHAMRSLFSEAADDMWRRAALLGTKSVRASVVRELLPIVRSSQLSFEMRNELVKWLFSVAIEEEQPGRFTEF